MWGGRRAPESGGEERQMFARPCADKNNASGVTGAKRWWRWGKRATIVPRREILCEKLEPDKGFLFFFPLEVNTVTKVNCVWSQLEGGDEEEGTVNFKASVTDQLPANNFPMKTAFRIFPPYSSAAFRKIIYARNFKQRVQNDLFSSFFKCRFNLRSFHLLNGSGGWWWLALLSLLCPSSPTGRLIARGHKHISTGSD